MTENASMTC